MNVIINCIKEELTCYEEMLSLSKRQKDAIISGNEDVLTEIINEKDILIEKIKKIDKTLADIINKETGVIDNSANILLKKIETTLSKINKIENNCRELVADKIKDISDKMNELRTGRQIASIYLKKSVYTPKFISMKK